MCHLDAIRLNELLSYFLEITPPFFENYNNDVSLLVLKLPVCFTYGSE